jgi:hypothetical protein
MTFNLFGGFKFASAIASPTPIFHAPAPVCAPAPAPAPVCNTGGLFGHSGGVFGNLSGGLLTSGHGILDNLLHHNDDHHGNDHHGAPGCGSGNGGHNGGHDGGTPAAGNNFLPIPSDTIGVTFSVDLNGDGVNDEYAVVKAPDNPTAADQTLQHYYDQVASDLATSHPDVPANQIVVKATIYSPSQGESYYHFNGDETTTEEQNADNDQDHHDDDTYDHNHGHEHDHDADQAGDHGSHDGESADCGADKDDSHGGGSHGGGWLGGSFGGANHDNFYSGLVSCDSGSHGDDAPPPESHDEAEDDKDDADNLHFC